MQTTSYGISPIMQYLNRHNVTAITSNTENVMKVRSDDGEYYFVSLVPSGHKKLIYRIEGKPDWVEVSREEFVAMCKGGEIPMDQKAEPHTVITFGKYRGAIYSDAVPKDQKYFRWALDTNVKMSKALRENIETALQLPAMLEVEVFPDTFTFGRWRSYSIKYVAQKDPGYLEWIINQDWIPGEFRDKVNEAVKCKLNT